MGSVSNAPPSDMITLSQVVGHPGRLRAKLAYRVGLEADKLLSYG